MRLFTRYVLREVCQIFLITLFALTTFIILVLGVQVALGKGLGAMQIIQTLPYLLPNALLFAVPGTILFAVSSVYGRMSASNEVVALKAMGISPMTIVWPALGLSVLLSFTTVWLNDLAMSWGYHGIQRVVVDSIEEIAYSVLRTNKTYRDNSSGFSVTVRAVEGRKLISPVFTLAGPEGEQGATISARSARLRSVPGSGALTLELYHAKVDSPDFHGEYPGQMFEYQVVINPNMGKGEIAPAHMALREIPEAITKQRERIERTQERMVASAGLGMFAGDFGRLDAAAWHDGNNQIRNQRYTLYKMQTEPPRRWANGFSCFCFALVGSAMAIRRRNGDALTSFFLCFLPILLVYYPLLMYGLDRSKNGVIHPYVVWLANAILVVWGLWLLRKVIRY